MKTIKSLLIVFVLSIMLFACTKTETIYTPNATIIPGNIVSSGDTTYVSSANLTYRMTRTSPCHPSNEIFYDSIISTNFPSNAEYKWDFGDGSPQATGTFVQHMYEYWNVYTVKLTVYVNGNIEQILTTSVKPYGQHATPFAVYGCQLNDYKNPNWVAFNAQTNITTGSIVNYSWDWKDGTTSSVATSYTEHLFPELNVDKYYKVKMTATSHAGCKDSFDDSTVFVPASYTNVGGITYTKTDACIDSEMVTFTQSTVGLPANATFEWDLGEGIRYWGNPLTHHFVYTKTYPVVCYIHIPSANGTIVRTVTRNTSIYALGSDIKPIPYLSKLTYLNPPTNDYIQFDGWGKVGDGHIITKLVWDFGDFTSDSSNTPYVFHKYNTPYPANKTYNVRLTVTASSGCIGTKVFPVQIP